jgi:hypothetical protein
MNFKFESSIRVLFTLNLDHWPAYEETITLKYHLDPDPPVPMSKRTVYPDFDTTHQPLEHPFTPTNTTCTAANLVRNQQLASIISFLKPAYPTELLTQ